MMRMVNQTDDRDIIAEMVFETDKYISEHIFGSKEQALSVLRRTLDLECSVYNCKDMFVHSDGRGGFDGLMIAYGPNHVSYEESFDCMLDVLTEDEMYSIDEKLADVPPIEWIDDGHYIQDIYVKPERRGNGIGRDMIEEYSNTVRKSGFHKLYLDVLEDNDASNAFYKRLGFEVYSKHTIPETYVRYNRLVLEI